MEPPEPIDDVMSRLAKAIDVAMNVPARAPLQAALREIESLRQRDLTPPVACELYFFEANVWSALSQLRHQDANAVWTWRQPEMEQELLALRRGRHGPGFDQVLAIRRAQLFTNEANLLNTIGRSLDALGLYREAQRIVPEFGMAMANEGIALLHLAQSHYDPGQAHLLMHRAWRCLTRAPREHLEPNAAGFFDEQAGLIAQRYSADFLNTERPFTVFSLGKTKAERGYRTWALEHGLFLNLLVGLGCESIAACDTLQLPDLVLRQGGGAGLVGLFTQIKQEFASARFLAWEGLHNETPHFSDRETQLVNTLDYAAYGLGVEKMKLAYRMAYSLLDKCAYLLNKYLSLGLKDNEVNLNTIWFTGGWPDRNKPNANLNPAVVDSANWPLRGLFWIARDIHDRDVLADPVDPDAKELKSIRDHLEHKYLKVVQWMRDDEGAPSPMRDDLAKFIERGELSSKLMHLLHLARSAVVYTSLGIHAEERRRKAAVSDEHGLVMPMYLPHFDDAWKI